jgi:hypothetical protein
MSGRLSSASHSHAFGPATFRHNYRAWIGFIVVLAAVLLAVAGVHNWRLLNSDAIAYMRLAEHYAAGRTHLMISGYWGPLISWLMVPWLWMGLPVLTAARIVMGGSGLVFIAGTVVLLRRLELPHGMQIAGAGVAAVSAVVWSVTEMTPDLLLAGVVALAVASMISEDWIKSSRGPCWTGAWWGIAYACKAVGLPVGLGCCGGLGFLWWLTRRDLRGRVVSSVIKTMLVFGLTAGPWICLISWKYHRPVFSTSAAIGHAIVGPNDVDRSQPFALQFHQPDPGRLTSWEDPSNLPYQYWSPWRRLDYARYQLTLMGGNIWVALFRLLGLDLIGLSWVVLAGGLVYLTRQCVQAAGRENVGPTTRWAWGVVPVLCVMGTYLPVYAAEMRFYYPCFPMLLAIGLGAIHELGMRRPDLKRLQMLLAGLMVLCFAGPGTIQLQPALAGFKDPAVISAWDLAHRLEKAGVEGPIAGSAMLEGQRVGLYVAFILGRPWYGDERHPTPEDFLKSGAAVMIFNRQDPSLAAFLTHPSLRDMDAELLADRADRDSYPLKVFRPLHR